jgi:hypothetical protein
MSTPLDTGVPNIKPARLETILPVIKTRILTVTGFPSERVVYSVGPGKPPESLQGDQFIVLRLRSQMTQQSIVYGAGRLDHRVVRGLAVVLWNRFNVDVDNQAEAFLLDPTNGILPAELLLLDALSTFHPQDSNGVWLCYEPLRIGPVSEPVPDVVGWAHSEFEVEVPYVLVLDQTYQ